MRDLLALFIYLIVAITRLMGSGGARALVAENLLLKQQMLVLNRARKRAPRLTVVDRFLFGALSLSLTPRRMFNQAIARKSTPKYLSSDNVPLFEYHRWQANLRILDIEEIKSIPYTPVSHPFVERLIGTIRREFLDHVFFLNANDLQRKLDAFQYYYNNQRVHTSISGKPPMKIIRNHAALSRFRWKLFCRGLYELPIAA